MSQMPREGLPFHVKKQVLQDIEDAGGIQKAIGKENYVSKLLNKLVKEHEVKKEIYGELGDPVRERIRKFVYTFSHIYQTEGPEAYEDKLAASRLGVVPFRFRETDPSIDILANTLSNLTMSSPNARVTRARAAAPAASPDPSHPPLTAKRNSPPSTPLNHLRTHFITPEDVPLPQCDWRNTTVVYANTLWPEHNREFDFIIDADDIPTWNGESSFYGFGIMMTVDQRDVSRSEDRANIKAEIYTRNSVMVTRPAMERCFEQGSPEMMGLEAKQNHKIIWKAVNNAHEKRKDMSEEEQRVRMTEKILIMFPEYVHLSSKNLYTAGNDSRELRPEKKIEHTFDIPKDNAPPGKGNKTFFYWLVPRIDFVSKKNIRVEKDIKDYDRQALDDSPINTAGGGQPSNPNPQPPHTGSFPFGSPQGAPPFGSPHYGYHQGGHHPYAGSYYGYGFNSPPGGPPPPYGGPPPAAPPYSGPPPNPPPPPNGPPPPPPSGGGGGPFGGGHPPSGGGGGPPFGGHPPSGGGTTSFGSGATPFGGTNHAPFTGTSSTTQPTNTAGNASFGGGGGGTTHPPPTTRPPTGGGSYHPSASAAIVPTGTGSYYAGGDSASSMSFTSETTRSVSFSTTILNQLLENTIVEGEEVLAEGRRLLEDQNKPY